MPIFIDAATIEKTLTPTALQYNSATQALANSTLSLTVTSSSLQFFTGSTTGQIVKLPDATTLLPGYEYAIVNQGTASLALQDGNAGALLTINGGFQAIVTLQLNNTVAGAWVIASTVNNGVLGTLTQYNVVASANFATTSATDVVITGFTVTPIAGTYAVWTNIDGNATTGNTNVQISIYQGGVQVANTLRTDRPGASGTSFTQVTQGVIQFNGSQACDVRVNTSAGTYTVDQRNLILIRMGA